MKLDILAFAAHPDDVELSCGGTIIKHVKLGYKVGIVDLTQGELGSRGTAETRKVEATDSSKILGLSVHFGDVLKSNYGAIRFNRYFGVDFIHEDEKYKYMILQFSSSIKAYSSSLSGIISPKKYAKIVPVTVIKGRILSFSIKLLKVKIFKKASDICSNSKRSTIKENNNIPK